MASFRHIVLFRIFDGASFDESAQLRDALVALGALPGITVWEVSWSADVRKGKVLALNGLFIDEAAFRAYQATPEHKQFAESASLIADWWIADYALGASSLDFTLAELSK